MNYDTTYSKIENGTNVSKKINNVYFNPFESKFLEKKTKTKSWNLTLFQQQ